jgi:hypothetical protein
MFLDAIVHLAESGRITGQGRDAAIDWSILGFVSVDWNIALIEGNRWFDRIVQTCRIPDRVARSSAFEQIEVELKDLELEKKRRRGPAILLSRTVRSEVVASIFVSLMLPAAAAAMNAEDRANTMLDLTRLAAVLAVFRAEHGTYPEKLDELVPGVVDKLPVDLYRGVPFVYHRTDDGYLLYSTGENGVDDGGSNENKSIFRGQAIDDLEPAETEKLRPEIPMGADDYSIRVPTPIWQLPSLSEAR